jgi:hypothetical protein
MRHLTLALALGAASIAVAACTPSAVATDAATLDTAISKDVADAKAFAADPSAALGEVLAQDGSALAADIAQLESDLGSAPPPARVASALKQASQLALELKSPAAAGGAGLVADADSVERDAKAAEAAGL